MNLYFYKGSLENRTQTRYYMGDEDGLYQAEIRLVSEGFWKPIKTGVLSIPFSSLASHLVMVKPGGYPQTLETEEDKILKPDPGFEGLL